MQTMTRVSTSLLFPTESNSSQKTDLITSVVIPREKYPVEKPVFFAAAMHDYISLGILGIATTKYHCKNATIREFYDGHWLMMSSPAEVNAALFSWIMDQI